MYRPSSAVTGTRNNKMAMFSPNINILSLPENVSNWIVQRKALLSIPWPNNLLSLYQYLQNQGKLNKRLYYLHDSSCLNHQYTFLVKPIKFLTQFYEKAIL